MTDDRSAVSGGPEELDTTATGIDTTVPHSARIWNYWLGGTDNFAVDRAAGNAWAATFPGIRDIARASRGFLVRSIPRPGPARPGKSGQMPHSRLLPGAARVIVCSYPPFCGG
jgi:hypothetical protein